MKMRHIIRNACTVILSVAKDLSYFLLLTTPLLAAEGEKQNLQSISKIGLHAEKSPSSDHQTTTGMAASAEVLWSPGTAWRMGARTLGSGGENRSHENFYRLAAGPLLSYEVMEHWSIETFYGYYRESSAAEDAYRATGSLFSVGWQKSWDISARARWAMGGYMLWNNAAQVEPVVRPSSAASWQGQKLRGVGISRGMTLGLAVDL